MTSAPRVGLFVTCLVDLFRPTVGFAAIKLIEDTGCSVDVPMAQTCCGQPAYNSGDRADTRAIAENTIRAFEDYDYVVAPSGSCAGMLKKHYPGLFKGDPQWEARASAFSAKVHELVSFLVDVRGATGVSARLADTVTYHDFLLGPARARHPGAAAAADLLDRGRQVRRDAGRRTSAAASAARSA